VQEQAAADYGTPITKQAADEGVRRFLAQHLKDPYSAMIDCGEPYRGYASAAPLAGRRQAAFGYLVDCSVNAKNSFGGYVGAKRYQFLFSNGTLKHAMGEQCLSGGGCYMAPLL